MTDSELPFGSIISDIPLAAQTGTETGGRGRQKAGGGAGTSDRAGRAESRGPRIDIAPDRVLELTRVAGRELIPHPLNWRMHPDDQLDILKRSIQRFGVATALLGYHSERNGGRLTILDGHGRVEINPEQIWPVVVLDITDEEADTLLMLIDPISGLAESDARRVLELAAKADVVDPVLAAFCMQLAEHTLQKERPPEPQKWPTLKLAIPPDVYQQWLSIVSVYEGSTIDAFMALLNAAGPFEAPEATEDTPDNEARLTGRPVASRAIPKRKRG